MDALLNLPVCLAGPDARTGQKTVFQTVTGEPFELEITEVIGFCRALIFLSDVAAGNARIVSGERNGNTIL